MVLTCEAYETVGVFQFWFDLLGFCLPVFGILALIWLLLNATSTESRCLPGAWLFPTIDYNDNNPGPWCPTTMIAHLEKQLKQTRSEKSVLEEYLQHYFNLYEALVHRNSALCNFVIKATNGVFRGSDDESIPDFDVALLVKSPTPANVHIPSGSAAEVSCAREVLELRNALAHAEAALLEQKQDMDGQFAKLQADLHRSAQECVAKDAQIQKLRTEAAKAARDVQRVGKKLVPRREAEAVRFAAVEAESLRKDGLIKELQAEVAQVTNEAGELYKVRDLLQADLYRSAQECNSYGSQVHVLQAALQSKAQECTNLERQGFALQADRNREAEQLLSQVAGLEQEKRQLLETVDAQNQAIERGNAGVVDLENEHNALNESLREQLTLAQQERDHQQQFPLADINDSAVRNFKKQVKDLKAELKEEEMSYLELQREVEYKLKLADTERRMLESEKLRLEQESEKFFEENCELQAKLDDKDGEIETLKDKQAPLQFTVPLSADKSVADAVAVAKQPLEKELKAKEREINEAKRNARDTKKKIEKLEANLTDYANRMATLEVTTVRNLRMEVKDLKKMLEEVGIDQ